MFLSYFFIDASTDGTVVYASDLLLVSREFDIHQRLLLLPWAKTPYPRCLVLVGLSSKYLHKLIALTQMKISQTMMREYVIYMFNVFHM